MVYEIEKLWDRRKSPRIRAALPIQYSDYHLFYGGKCTSIGFGGCFLEGDQLFGIGHELELKIQHVDGDELCVQGSVAWRREADRRYPAGMGVAFDSQDMGQLEEITDFVERLAFEDVTMAAYLRDSRAWLSFDTTLYHSRSSRDAPILSAGERSFLGLVDGVRTIGSLKDAVGEDRWEGIYWAAFSLCDKGLITTNKSMGLPLEHEGGLGMHVSGRNPSSRVESRNASAHEHYERAMESIACNDNARAIIELRLAIMLAPGDIEISQMLRELEEESR